MTTNLSFDAIVHGPNRATPYPSRVSLYHQRHHLPIQLRVLAVALFAGAATVLVWQAWLIWGTSWKVAPQVAARVQEFQTQTPTPAISAPTKRYDQPPPFAPATYGETFAVLHVPSWNNMALPVTEGTDALILDTGDAGHYANTAWPGELGNFALAGHRQTYGHNFRDVHKLGTGDPLIVETPEAYLIYRVTGTEIVTPQDISVIWPTPHQADVEPQKRLMTLTTCHPEYGNHERFIVYTELDYWTAKNEGKPGELT